MSTSGRNTPVPEQRVVADHLGCDLQCGRVHHLRHLWAERCAAAIAEKSTACASAMAAKMGHSGVTRPSSGQSLAVGAGEIGCAVGDCCAAAGGHQLKASATTFSWPGVCLVSDVNSAMKDSCRCWRADQGVVARNRDVTSGLWSVTSTLSLAPGGQLGRPAARGRTGNLTQVWACRQQRAKR
jgi:hypothetical protein